MKSFTGKILILMVVFYSLASLPLLANGVAEEIVFFSTEEEFIIEVPEGGLTVVSDGDLLSARGEVFMKNYELLAAFGVREDLGLDASDVLDADKPLVAFSTELDHPRGLFDEGDLLFTTGEIIPNAALLAAFGLPPELNLGLDAVQIVGKVENVRRLLELLNREDIILREDPFYLSELLRDLDMDIWFSTEGTAPVPYAPRFLDGDLLSAATGSIVISNANLFANSIPAGVPDRGVDFGLDAVMMKERVFERYSLRFSTELLYRGGNDSFTDGDVLAVNGGVSIGHWQLIEKFKPRALFLGVDALAFCVVPTPVITPKPTPTPPSTTPPPTTPPPTTPPPTTPPPTTPPPETPTPTPMWEYFFSTEEDFLSRNEWATGIISDGDLLNSNGRVYMRNLDLLSSFRSRYDLGLDAADVIIINKKLVAFSTELDDPGRSFTAGDLLVTNGAVLPNCALLGRFNVPRELNLGLDAVHFVGEPARIEEFLRYLATVEIDWYRMPERLGDDLRQFGIDIWFSTEGTAPTPLRPLFLDGDLLSAAMGVVIVPNEILFPNGVPAGIPSQGVDFGLDALSLLSRDPDRSHILFSTEILYQGKPAPFTDGDILRLASGLYYPHDRLILRFNPRALFLGLDALTHPRAAVSDL